MYQGDLLHCTMEINYTVPGRLITVLHCTREINYTVPGRFITLVTNCLTQKGRFDYLHELSGRGDQVPGCVIPEVNVDLGHK